MRSGNVSIRNIHTIDEVPEDRLNPFIAIIWETSLAPEIVLSCNYKARINEIVKDEMMFNERGALIGWFYLDDVMPTKGEYLRLVHLSAKNNYYKDLKL